MRKTDDKALVYIAGSSPNEKEYEFLDALGKVYVLRNAQFFSDKEPTFSEVYNLADSDYVKAAYGDKVVQNGFAKEEPKQEPKQVSAPKTTARKSTPKGD